MRQKLLNLHGAVNIEKSTQQIYQFPIIKLITLSTMIMLFSHEIAIIGDVLIMIL